jgi:hypothetical protein
MKKYLAVIASSNNKITKYLDFEKKADADAHASSRSGAFVVETPENKMRYWVVDADKKTVTFDKSTHDNDAAKSAAVAYKKKRRNEYPEIGEQLDMIYWDKVNGTTIWKDYVAKVKSDHPKPG